MKQRELPATLEALVNRHGLCIAKDSDLYRSHLVGWMLKAYEAALASPEVQAMRWQPIDTAPMDGRTILIGRFNSHGKWRTMRGQWMGEEYIAQNWEDPDDVEPGWFETSAEADETPNCWRIIEPTHWMPLPAPPAAATEKQK